jgi:hypothetical protein
VRLEEQNMTIREFLDKRNIKGFIVLFIGWVTFMISGIMSAAGKLNIYILVPIGILFMMGGMVYREISIKCPRCKSRLAHAVLWPMDIFLRISEKIKFCQFCGVSLDSEMGDIIKK